MNNTKTKIKARHIIMPSGTYWVGDPCLFFREHQWDHFLNELLNSKRADESYYGRFDGHIFAASHTHQGDGYYEDNYGETYCIESGLLGCIKVVDKHGLWAGGTLGNDCLIEWLKPFTFKPATSSNKYKINIGCIEISTL